MHADEKTVYQIVLEGKIDPSWSDWFQGFSVQSSIGREQRCTTLLSGPVIDQAALRGILNKVWDLNLTIVSVNRIKGDDTANEQAVEGSISEEIGMME